jgi:hypothetical protein
MTGIHDVPDPVAIAIWLWKAGWKTITASVLVPGPPLPADRSVYLAITMPEEPAPSGRLVALIIINRNLQRWFQNLPLTLFKNLGDLTRKSGFYALN